jgi:hypothetical protein
MKRGCGRFAENLHRADLTKLERDEQIAEWIDITEKVSSQLATKPQGGRPESGVRAAARDLGVDRDDAHRAVKVASLSDEAKETAREEHPDNNRSALLAASREKSPEAQVAMLKKYKAAPATSQGTLEWAWVLYKSSTDRIGAPSSPARAQAESDDAGAAIKVPGRQKTGVFPHAPTAARFFPAAVSPLAHPFRFLETARARASRWPRPQKEKTSQIAKTVVNAPMAMTAILK